MAIDISGILSCENKEIVEQVQLGYQSFSSELGDFPITKAAPIALRIVNCENKRLLISGQARLTVSIPCGRCLTEVLTEISFQIDRELRMTEDGIKDEDLEETAYLNGVYLDADRLIYEEILVNWPMNVLCKDDCRGICKVCGQNLNRGDCDCQKTEPDPRMAAIQDIFNQYKEV